MTSPAILSAIEAELVRVEGYIANLRRKVHAALQQTTDAASGATSASPTTPTLPIYLTTSGAFHPRGFWYRGTFRPCNAYIDIYIGLLRAVALTQPDALPRTAQALRHFGRTRTYLATNPEHLFQNQTAEWARSHSIPVAEGWYADTNLSLVTMRRLTRRILQTNGLRDGIDVVILWNHTPARSALPRNSPAGIGRSTH